MKEKKDLKTLDVVALKQEVDSLRKELFNLKLNKITGQVKDYTQYGKLKTQIARALTYITQQEQAGKQNSENKKATKALR